MPRRSGSGPTDFELRILKVLWDHGPSSARQVQERLRSRPPAGYTTVLKMLQVMEGKGMVTVDRRQRAHVYAARLRRTSTLRRLVNDFVQRAFDGDPQEMLVHLLKDGRLGEDQLTGLEAAIAELRRKEESHDGDD